MTMYMQYVWRQRENIYSGGANEDSQNRWEAEEGDGGGHKYFTIFRGGGGGVANCLTCPHLRNTMYGGRERNYYLRRTIMESTEVLTLRT